MEEPEPKEQLKTSKSKKHDLDTEEKEGSTLSKAEKKKLKKLKGKNGEAVPVGDKEAQKEEAPSAKKDKKKEKSEAGTKQEPVKGVREVTGGVKVQDIKPGNGTEAKKGHTVRMRYIGKLDDGSVFDSNTKGKPVRTSAMVSSATDLVYSLNLLSEMGMSSRAGTLESLA